MTILLNFGKAVFIQTERSRLIQYPSRVYQNVIFKFCCIGKRISTMSYRCVACNQRSKKIIVEDRKVKIHCGATIVVKDGIIITDPDNPKQPHICLENDTSENDMFANEPTESKNFGKPAFVASPTSRFSRIQYASRVHHNIIFEFFYHRLRNNIIYYRCTGCVRFYRKQKMRKIKVSYGAFIGVKNGIMIIDPDNPKIPHTCIEAKTYHMVADITDNQALLDVRNEENNTGKQPSSTNEESLSETPEISNDAELELINTDKQYADEEMSTSLSFTGATEVAPLKSCFPDKEFLNNATDTLDSHERNVVQSEPLPDEEAVERYRRAAEEGNAEAQSKLGDMYFWGQGVPRSIDEAVKWYRKAAEQGYKFP